MNYNKRDTFDRVLYGDDLSDSESVQYMNGQNASIYSKKPYNSKKTTAAPEKYPESDDDDYSFMKDYVGKTSQSPPPSSHHSSNRNVNSSLEYYNQESGYRRRPSATSLHSAASVRKRSIAHEEEKGVFDQILKGITGILASTNPLEADNLQSPTKYHSSPSNTSGVQSPLSPLSSPHSHLYNRPGGPIRTASASAADGGQRNYKRQDSSSSSPTIIRDASHSRTVPRGPLSPGLQRNKQFSPDKTSRPPTPPPKSIPLPNLPSCFECNVGVGVDDGFEIPALGGWFHSDCFKCVECRVLFDDFNPFVPYNGLAYCETHYQNALARGSGPRINTLPNGNPRMMPMVASPEICGGCEAPIGPDEKMSYAFGRAFHAKHLKCHVCDNRIKGAHVEYNGKAYCQQDYTELTTSPCTKCRKPIESDIVHALGTVWHRHCFGCTTCHEVFKDKKFFVFEKQPYCLQHYYQAANALCKSCKLPIEGVCVDIEDELGKLSRYHGDCWRCDLCGEGMDDVYFSVAGGVYCERDVDEVVREMGRKGKIVNAQKRRTLVQQ